MEQTAGGPYKSFILPAMLAFCTLFYYFGELVQWAAWNSLREDFFYSVHDVHRLLFLAPIVYAGYTARVRGAALVTLIAFIIFLPRAFFISPYPDPLLRMVLFTIIAGVIGCLVGVVRNESERSRNLEIAVRKERDKLLSILDSIADGVMLTGPDYRVRFLNTKMVEALGEGAQRHCYEYLFHRDAPCREQCQLPDVIKSGEIGKWQYHLIGAQSYEVLATPYVDRDGVTCQLSVFRKISHN